MENQKLTDLRQKHPTFTYHSAQVEYQADVVTLKFLYSFNEDLKFETTLLFHGISNEQYQKLDPQVLKSWAFHIGMVESLSYWKAACSPKFVIEAGDLNTDQTEFWQNLIKKGMSEFFFINQIDGWQDNFVTFVMRSNEATVAVDMSDHLARVIVPVGGGKDSLVSLELLTSAQQNLVTLTIQPTDQVINLLSAVQQNHTQKIPNILVERILDPKILQLNEQGYLNGHTPFSAMAAFVTSLAAYIFNFKYIAVSNEFSANEGNTTFLGQTINHQYSKTVEFESLFREYSKKYLSTQIEYFSYLRPLHEIQIARLFANSPQYFSVFLSCNRGQKTGHWCGECAKCLFVYSMLSPFVNSHQLEEIWGKDLFAKESLRPILDELAGVIECKSFDCVGTREEMLISLYLAVKRRKEEGKELPVLLEYAQEKLVSDSSTWEAKTKVLLSQFENQNFVPTQYMQIFLNAMEGEKNE